MTQRVIEWRAGPPPVPRDVPRSSLGDNQAGRGFKTALLTGSIALLVASAVGQPAGTGAATLTLGCILLLQRLFDGHVRWGWLALLTLATELVVPPTQLGLAGPALFVAWWTFLALWLAYRGRAHGPMDGRPRPGSPERAAQLLMGAAGEREVGRVLGRDLPNEFVLVNGLKLPRGAGDIDHLVVGPTGVFLIETKTMVGRIRCAADGSWSRLKRGRGGTAYTGFIGDPAAQVERNIAAVRGCLRRRVPRLLAATRLWIHGLIVFPHPKAELSTEHSRVPAIRLEELTPRICLQETRRPLQPDEVQAVVDALLAEAAPARAVAAAQPAQVLVEAALVLPILVALVFGIVAISRVVQAHTAVVAVAHEAARAGAFGSSPADAARRSLDRAQQVAAGLALDRDRLDVAANVSGFARQGGRVMASATYQISLGDLPLVGWAPSVSVRAEHVEWLDPYRAGILSALEDAD